MVNVHVVTHLTGGIMVALYPGYFATLTSDASRARYRDKLQLIDGIDSYEVVKDEWSDDLDLWPAITHVHACMYLILTPNPYSEKDMLNYKSLDSYQSLVKAGIVILAECCPTVSFM